MDLVTQIYSFIGLLLLYELLHSIFYFQIIHITYPLVLLKFELHLHDLTAVLFETGAKSVPTKSQNHHLWLSGLVSLKIKPILRVLSISGFSKVIHAPKTPQTPKKRVESGASKINFLHSNFFILVIGTSHRPYKHPHVKE